MPYIYENDVTQTGGNLQKTVAYLLSLHKNEYEWNLLGIKVVGHVDALPIPDSDYEYGDAYTVGTAAPYDMWIYTRADEFHAEAYWFNIGKFPAPGPQGPKGDGFDQLTSLNTGTPQSVVYDTTHGAVIDSNAQLTYKDSTTGSTKTQDFPMTTTLPIMPGKYISMDSSTTDDTLTVKVDDTALALDYIKISKTETAEVTPVIENGKVVWYPATQYALPKSVVWRNANADCYIRKLYLETIANKDGTGTIDFWELWNNTIGCELVIDKTSSDTGILTATQYSQLTTNQGMNRRIVYNNQVYYRMDPRTAPDGTLNYIHIDSIQDGDGGYKATGKGFSVTVSTRAWQVVDLDFGGSTRTTHNLTITNSATGTTIYFSLTNNRPETYEGAPAGLWSALENSPIACTVDSNGVYSAGMITIDGDNFKAIYGNSEELLMTQEQIGILDNMV